MDDGYHRSGQTLLYVSFALQVCAMLPTNAISLVEIIPLSSICVELPGAHEYR